MLLPELRALLSDPVPTPFEVDWAAVEGWLGTRLPTAYKQIGSTFGPWDVGDWLWIEVPCGDQPGFPGYSAWVRKTIREARIDSRDDEAAHVPDFHPTRGGLLPWGESRTTDRFFWDTTESDPDLWPVVVYAVDVGQGVDPWVHTGLTLVDFLGALVADGIQVSPNRMIGPRPHDARRTDYRLDAVEWTPPPPSARESSPASRLRAVTEGNGIGALRALVPPSGSPHLGDGGWESLFAALGSRLPSEYLELMGSYGAGMWRSYLRFPPPLDSQDDGLVARSQELALYYRELRDDYPDDFPLAVWPEPGGFLPFADTIDGDVLGWLTVGDADDWPVVVFPRHDDQGPPLETGLVESLLAFMRGREVGSLAALDPDDDPLDFATFAPWQELGR